MVKTKTTNSTWFCPCSSVFIYYSLITSLYHSSHLAVLKPGTFSSPPLFTTSTSPISTKHTPLSSVKDSKNGYPCLYPQPFVMWLCSSSIKKSRLFLHLINLDLSCDLLSTTECTRNNMPVLSPGLRKSSGTSAFYRRSLLHHKNMSRLIY